MKRLYALMEDEFYAKNEAVARSHNEGANEALVVAAKVFVSHKLGRRDARSVYEEFAEYVDGSLVLAPIIYVHLSEKLVPESLNDFVLSLFDNGIIKSGAVEQDYKSAMKKLASFRCWPAESGS